MDTIVWILILLVAFSFVLKQSFWPIMAVWGIAAMAAVFIVLMWPYAIEQSKTQIADWLANPALMQDTAVFLTIEVALQMIFCLLSVHVANFSPVKRRMTWVWKTLYWFPGILIFPVLFFGLTQLIFAMPGISFQQVAWGFGFVVLIVIPLVRWVVKVALPEEDLRLELFFLMNALIVILGVIATVNGRTAVEGTAIVNWYALLGCIGVFVAGGAIGMLTRVLKRR